MSENLDDLYENLFEGLETPAATGPTAEEPGGFGLPVEQALTETYKALEEKRDELDDDSDPNYVLRGMYEHSIDLIDKFYEDIKNDFNTVWNEGKDLSPIGSDWSDSGDNWPQKRLDAAQRLLGKTAGAALGAGALAASTPAALAGAGIVGTTAAAAKGALTYGSAALLPPAMAYYYSQYGDSEQDKERYEAITGEKFYDPQELASADLPPEEKDRIRSKQGDLLDKAKYGAEMMIKGVVDIASNPVKEWDKADSAAQKALLVAEVIPAFVAGAVPMTIGATTDFTNSFLTDPIGTATALQAAKLSAIKARAGVKGFKEGGVKRALAERKAADIQTRDQRLDLGRAISNDINKVVDKFGEESNVGRIGRAIQAMQRGDNILTLPTSLVPGFGYRGAGSRDPELQAMKDADRRTSGNVQKLRAELDDIATNNPFAFGMVARIMTDNQKIAPETYLVFKDLEATQKSILKDMKATEKALKKKNIQPEQLTELQRHQRKLNEFQERINDARKRVDPEALDAARIEAAQTMTLKGKPLLKWNRDKKTMRLMESKWADAARASAAHVPRMAKITYEGKPVTPLEFMLRPPKNLDAAKFGIQIMKDIPPEARLLLEQNSSAMVSIMQMMADQGQRLTKLVGPKNAALLKDEVFLLNTASGYAPKSRVKDHFDTSSVAAGMGQLDIANQHLTNMKVNERKGKLPSIEETIEEIKTDREAFEQFNQYANAMEHTIGAMEFAKNVELALEKTGRISNEPRPGYTLIGSKKPEGGKPSIKERLTDYAARKIAKEPDELVLKSDLEFGNLQGKYVPTQVAKQLVRYDRYYGAIRETLRASQQVFKTTHTITNIPYFSNTAGGLAYTQTLFGGTPMSPFIGAARFAAKDKYYRALRDAGGIVDSDTLIGLESNATKKKLIGMGRRLQRAFEKRESEGSMWSKFPKMAIELYENWKTPIDPLYKKRGTGKAIGALGTAALAGTAGLGAGLFAGFSATPIALGMGTGFLMSKGRQLATLLDQGSRVESFARRMNELAFIEAARTGEPKAKVLDRLLKDPEALNNATNFALYSNIDYSYVPFGVEHASALLPQTPFIKFAHRAGEMMLDMPLNNPKAFASLSSIHQQYMRDLGEKEKWIYANAPFNTGGMLVALNDRDYINMAYMMPFSPSTIMDAITGIKYAGSVLSAIPGLEWMSPNFYGYPHSASLFAKQIAEPERSLQSGYLGGLSMAIAGKDRYGYDLPDSSYINRAKEFVKTYSPSSIYYLGQIKEAENSPDGKDRYGYTADQIFMNSIGAKYTPGSLAGQRLERARKAFRSKRNKLQSRINFERKKQRQNPEKAEANVKALRKKMIELDKLFASAIDGDTISMLNKISGFPIKDVPRR